MGQLDQDYANAAYIANAENYPPRWEKQAQAFCKSIAERAHLGLPYGGGTREVFDLFMPEDDPLGVVIFVHGGYWRAFDRSSWSHLAAGPLGRGWAVAMPSYDLCPDVGIAQITEEIAQAVKIICARVAGPVALAGHSAGGHLVARMLAPGMLPEQLMRRIGKVVPISPLADLEPLMQTDMNRDFKLTRAEALSESPVYQPAPEADVTVWVGADERPAFLMQAEMLSQAWGCGHIVEPGRHHFDVIDALADPKSEMTRRLTGGAS